MNKKIMAIVMALFTILLVASASSAVFADDPDPDDITTPDSPVEFDDSGYVAADDAEYQLKDSQYQTVRQKQAAYEEAMSADQTNKELYFNKLTSTWEEYTAALETYYPEKYNASEWNLMLQNMIQYYNDVTVPGAENDPAYLEADHYYKVYLANYAESPIDYGQLNLDWRVFVGYWLAYNPNIDPNLADLEIIQNLLGNAQPDPALVGLYNTVITKKKAFYKLQAEVLAYLSTEGVLENEAYFYAPGGLMDAWMAYVDAYIAYEEAVFGVGESNFVRDEKELELKTNINKYLGQVTIVKNYNALIKAANKFEKIQNIFLKKYYNKGILVLDEDAKIFKKMRAAWIKYVIAYDNYYNIDDPEALSTMMDLVKNRIHDHVEEAIATDYNNQLILLNGALDSAIDAYEGDINGVKTNFDFSKIDWTNEDTAMLAFDDLIKAWKDYVDAKVAFNNHLYKNDLSRQINDDQKEKMKTDFVGEIEKYIGNYLIYLAGGTPDPLIEDINRAIEAFQIEYGKICDYVGFPKNETFGAYASDDNPDGIGLRGAWERYIKAHAAYDPVKYNSDKQEEMIEELEAAIRKYLSWFGNADPEFFNPGISIVPGVESQGYNGWNVPMKKQLDEKYAVASNNAQVTVYAEKGFSIYIRTDNKGAWYIGTEGVINNPVYLKVTLVYNHGGSGNTMSYYKEFYIYLTEAGGETPIATSIGKDGKIEYMMRGTGPTSINKVYWVNPPEFAEFVPPETFDARGPDPIKPEITFEDTVPGNVGEADAKYVPSKPIVPSEKPEAKFEKLTPGKPQEPGSGDIYHTAEIGLLIPPFEPPTIPHNPPIKPTTPPETPKNVSHESITATNNANNPIVVANSNHFCLAELNLTELRNGKEYILDLVVGNKFNVVGQVTVKLVVDDKGKENLVIILPDGTGSFGAVAFADAKPVPSNGNIHSNGFGFKHNNNANLPLNGIVKKNTEIIYLYLHFAKWTFPAVTSEPVIGEAVIDVEG